MHTQHTGQHGDDGLVELIPWSWPGGSHGATTPLPGRSWGSEPGSGLECTLHWSRGNTGTHPWPAPRASPMGSDPTRGRQCGHTGSTRRPGQNGDTPLHARARVHRLLCFRDGFPPNLSVNIPRASFPLNNCVLCASVPGACRTDLHLRDPLFPCSTLRQ